MLSLYQDAWQSVRANWLLYSTMVILLEAVEMLDLSSAGMLVVHWIVLYQLHRFFLFGEISNGQWFPPGARKNVGWFLLASFLLTATIFSVPALALWALLPAGTLTPDGRIGAFVVYLVLVFMFALPTTALFGTALPAAAAGDRFGPAVTLRRSRGTGWSVVWGLIVGPVLFSALTIGTYIALAASSPILSESWSDTDGIQPVALVVNLALRMIGLVNSTLGVAVLCRAYRKAVPPPIGGSDASPSEDRSAWEAPAAALRPRV